MNQANRPLLLTATLTLLSAVISAVAQAKGPNVGNLTDTMFDKVRSETKAAKSQALVAAPADQALPPQTIGQPVFEQGQGGVALSVPGTINQVSSALNQRAPQSSEPNSLARARANPDFYYSSPTSGFIKVGDRAISLDQAPVILPLGDWNLYAIQDRPNSYDPKLLKTIGKRTLGKLADAHAVDGEFAGSLTVFVLDTGAEQILFDSGLGSCRGETGKLTTGLQAAGFTPSDIDKIMITHAHSDHVCGLITETGAAAYPNATVFISAEEFDFWAGDDPLKGKSTKKKAELRPTSDTAIKAFAPYVAANRLTTFEHNQVFQAGIEAVKSVGHTPGHSSYAIERGGKRVFVTGDMAHVKDVQLAYPTTTITYDVSPVQAVVTRLGDFKHESDVGSTIASIHFPYPGLGTLERSGQSYRMIPAKVTKLPAR